MTVTDTYASWKPSVLDARIAAATEDGCAADPAAPPFNWVYDEASLGFVLSGWFEYTSEGASVLAAPGSVVLGNAGEHFSVRHIDTLGNRRLVVSFKHDLLNEVARESDAEPRFGAIALPPGQHATRMFALMRTYSHTGAEDVLYPLAQAALTAQQPRAPGRITARDRRRVQAAVQHIEMHFDEPCSLQSLADMVGLSRFHFVRMFGAVAGQSPNQYLINTRMRAAAERLITTKTPIAQIAFEVGFNDISHFYACFREAFACTPRQWRLRA